MADTWGDDDDNDEWDVDDDELDAKLALNTGAPAVATPKFDDEEDLALIEREKLAMATLPELSMQILEQARATGRVTMGDMVRITEASRNTLKEHFRRLVEQGHLVQHGSGKGTWYTT